MARDVNKADLIAEIRQQVLYLQELGVEGLDVDLERLQGPGDARVAGGVMSSGDIKFEISNLRSDQPNLRTGGPDISDLGSATPRKSVRPAGSRLAELPSLTKRKPAEFFDKYNPAEERRETGDARQDRPHFKSSEVEVVPERADVTETIPEIRAEIGPDCMRCPLHALGRTKVVNSIGNFSAELMFVGEAPGADEDRMGEPFVGRAGQLLTDIIEKGLEIPRSEVFIGNINRCRPPGNRTPLPDEAAVCKPFLLREIAVVRPKVIIVLGAHAAQTLLETKTPISRMRGRFHDLNGVKVMPTFHPAYLLRDPHKKREVWEDIKIVRDYLRSTR